MPKLSSLLSKFSEPETLKMAKLGRELRAQGIDVIDLSLGEPDFDTPVHIKEAAKKAIDDNWSHYTPVAGFADLREAIAFKFKRDNNLDFKPEQIIASTGAKQTLANVILATVDAGDEVVIPGPFWVTYSELVRIAGGVPVVVRTAPANKYKITPEELEAAITPKTTAFLFSSPCNPSGTVYTKEELAALVAVFEKHPDVYILSDEIYEYINFVGKHESIAQFPSISDRVIVINGLSKGSAMTGWRLGVMAGPLEVVKACEKLQGQFTSATCSITQKAAVAAFLGNLDATSAMVEEFRRRREKVLSLIKDIPGLEVVEPDGAFYVFPVVKSYYGKSDGTQTIKNADDMAMYLLNVAHVSSVSGSAFGESDSIRLSFANSMANLEKGWARIKEALAKLQ